MTFVGGSERLISGDERGTVRLRDVETGKERRVIGENAGTVHDIAVTGSGLLAVGGGSGSVRLWDIREGKQLLALRLGGQAWSVAFSPDGRLPATGEDGGILDVLEGGPEPQAQTAAKISAP